MVYIVYYYDVLDYGGYRGPAGCWYSVERPAADVAQYDGAAGNMVVGGPEAETCCWPYRPPAKSDDEGADGTTPDDGPAAA